METPEGMVPFDIEKAKKGEKVITRNGRNVRILCYDAKIGTTCGTVTRLIALITQFHGEEEIFEYVESGRRWGESADSCQLFHPAPEMWINIYKLTPKTGGVVYASKDLAKSNISHSCNYLGTYKLVKE
jgi:hypothetical protein